MALDLYSKATIGCRKVSRVLKVISNKVTMPHHTTVRNWVIRNGCYALQKPLEKSNDWFALGDVTIDIGKIKCLAILGVQISKLEARGNYTLTHEDVSLIGLYPTEKSNGEFVHKSWEEARDRLGCDFFGAVIDQGPDIKKGVRLFQEEHSEMKIFYDIAHKMSLVVKHTFEEDPGWLAFTKKLLETRRLGQQTEFAAMMPGNQRSKARFMDISYLIEWPRRIWQSREDGFLNSVPKTRYEQYFGWIKEFEPLILDWEYMIGTFDMIKGFIGEHGLSRSAYEYLEVFFKEAPAIENEKIQIFTAELLKVVKEESDKLDDEQIIPCSTEVLESAFGKFKEINGGYQGITSNILSLATFLGSPCTEKEIKQTMETCSVKEGLNWIKGKIGDTLGAVRYRFFRGIKGTKFDTVDLHASTP